MIHDNLTPLEDLTKNIQAVWNILILWNREIVPSSGRIVQETECE